MMQHGAHVEASMVAAAKAAREVTAEEVAATVAVEVAKAEKEAGEEGSGECGVEGVEGAANHVAPLSVAMRVFAVVVCTPGHLSPALERIQGTLRDRWHSTNPRPFGATRTKAH
jgi:hypothetical protein